MIAARSDVPVPLTRHLAELRRALIVAGGAWLAATVAAFVANGPLLYVLLHPLQVVLAQTHSVVPTAIFTTPTEGLTVPLKVAATAGVALAAPVVLWQGWTFVSPGLTSQERRVALPLGLSAIVLFLAGAAFAFFVMPVGLRFLASFLGNNATFLPDIGAYLTFFTILIVAFGVTFELPVAVILLGLARITTSQALRRRRRAVWVGIVATALLVTPGADPFTPTMLFVPLLAMFEASVLILDKVLHR